MRAAPPVYLSPPATRNTIVTYILLSAIVHTVTPLWGPEARHGVFQSALWKICMGPRVSFFLGGARRPAAGPRRGDRRSGLLSGRAGGAAHRRGESGGTSPPLPVAPRIPDTPSSPSRGQTSYRADVAPGAGPKRGSFRNFAGTTRATARDAGAGPRMSFQETRRGPSLRLSRGPQHAGCARAIARYGEQLQDEQLLRIARRAIAR